MIPNITINLIAPIFYKLLYMSITAFVVGIIIVLIRRFADKRFSPFWKYAMWVLVLVALVIPWRPQSPLAVMHTTERIQQISFRTEYETARTEYFEAYQSLSGDIVSPESSEQAIEAKAHVDSLHVKTLIFDGLLPSLWLLGVAVIGLFMLYSGLRLGRKIRISTIPFETNRYETTLQSCKNKLGMKRWVRIIMQSYVKTPALFGFFRPKIILPEYAESLSDRHLEYVILHELYHLKRGDSMINTLLLALQTVYWFNPLTWLFFKFIREDMELANDAAVLKGMDAENQKEYSLSLVEVLAGTGKPALAPRLLCMVDSEKNMERRINMIKLGEFFKRRKWVIAVTGMLVIAVTAALFLTVGATSRSEIPSLYIITVDGNSLKERVIETVRGNYDWNSGMLIRKHHTSDAQPAYGVEYNEENTVTIGRGQPIYLSNKSKEGHFNGKDIKAKIYYSDGTPYDAGVDLAFVSKNYFVLSLNETGEFIYEFEIDYGRGKVSYGFKVISKDYLPDHTLGWAKNLQLEDIARIELIDSAPTTTGWIYKDLNKEELNQAFSFIKQTGTSNSSGAEYVPNPMAYERAYTNAFFITTKDGTIHSFGNHYDEHLVIDKVYWRVNTDWLVSGFAQFAADEPVPDGFWDRINANLFTVDILSTSDKRKPGVRVTIEEYFGGADTALEVIYEDGNYKYSLSSIRSDKIMVIFEDGKRLSLKEAIIQKKISIEDLILNGLQVMMEPKNNPMGGYFNIPSHLHRFYIEETAIYPSNTFMYTAANNGYNSYFAFDELISHIEACGYQAEAKQIREQRPFSSERYVVEGIEYIRDIALESFGMNIKIGWEFSSHMPVRFSFSDSSGKAFFGDTSSNLSMSAEDREMFSNATKISSDQFLSVKKNMTMKKVMDTLGKTSHVIGQGPSSMYYYVDGKPLKIDFVNLSDPYPFSGVDMKQYFDTFGTVNYKIVTMENVLKLSKGMKAKDITKSLGNTIDIGSGRNILIYLVWDGLSITQITLNFGGNELPYHGKEIYTMISSGQTEMMW